MSTTRLFIMWCTALGMGPLTVGCNREMALSPPPPVEVIISQPVSEPIADVEEFTGTVSAKESVEIRAQVRGQIKEVLFSEGEEIAQGKLLFIIDDDPFQADLKQAEGQLKTWDAKLTAADEKIKIYKPLAEKGTVAKEELIQALAAKGDAIGGIDTAKGKIMEADVNIKYCKISAPIAGKVGQAMLTKGNLVNSSGQDNLLTTVVGVDPLYVYFYVNERALLDFQESRQKQFERDKKAQKLDLPVSMALSNESGYPHAGVIDFVDNKVDPGTGSIKVRARFDNPKGPNGRRPLVPGLFARVRVSVSEPLPAVLIAERAMLSDQSLKYVLVVNKAKNNVVERVDITPANRPQPSGLVVVETGLKGDEWVIVEGNNRARPGATVKATEGKMPRRPVRER
jgi:RND family efflux transporter MFP subunit